MKKFLFYLFIFLILLSSETSYAQYFGQNKVNYTDFKWEYISTKNFDIYFTEGGYEIALIASEIAEDSYESISKHWNYTLTKRIPIIVYNSHNDFSQTNVILEMIEEGVGGFTELFKNRVVIPWEGSLDKFEHVIHHELTHAVMFDMLYGGILESIMGREYLFQLPLWFAEGLAEHESQYWSTEADMIVRDGIITGYLPDIQNTYGGYLVYKGGESFFKFIQEKYGNSDKWIAGEILHSLKNTKNVEKSFKSVLGKSIEDLSKEWHRKLREDHWSYLKLRELPEDFATKLTDHKELENYINMNPTFNPTGDKIAFLTDRSGYKEIMLMSAIDGRILDTIVKGEKAGDYEEMHWLRGGITWSPDGKMLAFSTKAGDKDAINIKKVEYGGFDKVIKPDMDAIYSPDWSPDGSKILFCGIKDGKLDLFTVDIETETYVRLTNDFFDEFDPRWSPDGKKIVFSSDRVNPPYEYTINQISDAYNIFIMNADGSDVKQIVDSPFNDSSPDWSPDGNDIVFTSDRNGIVNLYSVDTSEMSIQPLTNLLTGASSPVWSPDGTKIAFTCFEEGGWDIYLLKRPLLREIKPEDISPTTYRSETQQYFADTQKDSSAVIFSDSGFGQQFAGNSIKAVPYKIKFSPDMFNAFASYNTFIGFGGMGQISLSDIMGNHRIDIAGDLYYSLEESNVYAAYFSLKRQTNFGIGLFHYKTYYRSSNWDIFSDRTYGGSLLLSRPFSKFNRLDLNLNLLRIERNAYSYNYPVYNTQKLEGIRSMTVETEFVRDNALWGNTGPINGERYKFNVEYSPPIAQNDLSYTTVELDYRKYYRFGRRYNFITRFSGGASFGDNPRMFFLGGTDYWLNARIARVEEHIERSQDLFFARFPFPLRGYKYYEVYGSKYFLTNFEFRFPFIQYLAMGWPIPLVIGNISGTLFTDIGSAWEKYSKVGNSSVLDKSFHGIGQSDNGSFLLDDIKMSWGFGMRMNLGFAVVRIDTAWQALQMEPSSKKPFFMLSIGPDF